MSAKLPPSSDPFDNFRGQFDPNVDSNMVLDEDVNHLPYDDTYDPKMEKHPSSLPQMYPNEPEDMKFRLEKRADAGNIMTDASYTSNDKSDDDLFSELRALGEEQQEGFSLPDLFKDEGPSSKTFDALQNDGTIDRLVNDAHTKKVTQETNGFFDGIVDSIKNWRGPLASESDDPVRDYFLRKNPLARSIAGKLADKIAKGEPIDEGLRKSFDLPGVVLGSGIEMFGESIGSDAIRDWGRAKGNASNFERAMTRGVVQAQGPLFSGAENYARTLGFDDFAGVMKDAAQSANAVASAKSMKTGIDTMADIRSEKWVGDTAEYVANMAVSGLGNMGAQMAFYTGGKILGFGALLTQSIGGVRQELQQEGIKDEKTLQAYSYTVGTAVGLLERIMPEQAMNALSSKMKKDIVNGLVKTVVRGGKRKAAEAIGKELGKGLLRGAVTEGTTEALQEVIQIAGVVHATKASSMRDLAPVFEAFGKGETWVRIGDALVAGALPGGVIGTGARGGQILNNVSGLPQEAVLKARDLGFGGKPQSKDATAAQPEQPAKPSRQARSSAEIGDQPIAATPIPTPDSTQNEVVTPDGSMAVPVETVLVELSDLVYATGDLQPRDRSLKESAEQTRYVASNLDPSRLMPQRVSDVGAPIIAPDGTILSGNMRARAMSEVYSDPQLAARAEAYRAFLPPEAAKMKNPVLVRRIKGDVSPEELVRFADRSNRPAIAQMGVTERAQRDARAAGDDVMRLYAGGDFARTENREFLRSFVNAAVSPTERGAMAREGLLTKEGEDRLTSAVLAATYAKPELLSRMLESTDDNIRSISGALRDAAGAILGLKQSIKNGETAPEFDITSHIAEAALRIATLRDKGVKPAEALAQQDAFAPMDPVVEGIVRAFYNEDLTRPVSRKAMTEFLIYYANEAKLHSGEKGLIPDETTPTQVLDLSRDRVIRGDVARDTADLFAPSTGAGSRDLTGDGQAAVGSRPDGSGPAAGQEAGDVGTEEFSAKFVPGKQASPKDRQAAIDQGQADFLDEVFNVALDELNAEPTNDQRTAFRAVLASTAPRKDWAGLVGATTPQIETLEQEAIRDGLLRQTKTGQVRRTAKAKDRPASPAAETVDIDAPNFGMPEPPKTIPDGDPLLTPHWDDDPAKQDTSPEREAMRQRLIDQRFAGKQPAPKGRKPMAVLMGGGGASGKGTLLGYLAKTGELNPEPFVELDPDSFKTGDPEKGWEGIPEYWEIDARGDSRGAGVTHEESSHTYKTAQKRGMDGRYDMILDQTLGTPAKAEKLIKTLKDNGYHVVLLGVTVEPEVAIARAVKRAKGPERRYVPLNQLLAAHKGFSQGFEVYSKLVDKASLFYTNVPINARPVIIAGHDLLGDLTIRDKAWYSDFARKGQLDEKAQTIRSLRASLRPLRKTGEGAAEADRPGAVGAGPARARGQDAASSAQDPPGVPGERLTQQGPDIPALSIPADVRIARAISMREDASGSAVNEVVADYAYRIEDVRSDVAAVEALVAEISADKMMRKNDALELAHLVGYAPKKSTTKKAALESILERARDYASGQKVADLFAQEPANDDLRGPEGGIPEGNQPESLQADEGGRDLGGSPATGSEGSVGDVRPAPGADDGVTGSAARIPGTPGSSGSDTIDSGRDRAERDRVRALVEKQAEERRARIAGNYQITDADEIGAGGAKGKVRANIAAIKVLRALQEERREATPEEKAVLVKFTGWGQFSQAIFDDKGDTANAEKWKSERVELKNLLSREEWESAKESTINAHYTSPEVIRGMYEALSHLGWKGEGRAIEPAAGAGHFIGMQAEGRNETSWTAVELDTLTGGILKALYTGTDVRIAGFETQKFPNDFFDLAISNVPFGKTGPHDPAYNKLKLNLHNYFFIKSLDKVRPGGVVAFITSSFTMDSKNDLARREMMKRADLIGAIRLPGGSQGAFKANAGTDVTTDILFLRKRGEADQIPDWAQDFQGLEEIETPEGPIAINSYFAQNPDMMLGKMRRIGTQYGPGEPVLIGPSSDLDVRISDVVKEQFPADVFVPASRSAAESLNQSLDTETDGIKEGAYYEKDGKVYRKVEGVGRPVVGAAVAKKLRSFMAIRDLVNELLNRQSKGERGLDNLRKDLEKAYDSFVKQYGPINKTQTTVTKRLTKTGEPVIIRKMPNFSVLKDDPDAYKVSAIEIYDEKTDRAEKTAIFFQDVLETNVEPDVQSPVDALAVSLNQRGKVDMTYIAEKLAVSEDEAAELLGNLVYKDPAGGQWHQASAYLSGDVKTKLADARAAAEADPSFARNVAALEEVQPPDLTRADIRLLLGAPWVDASIYKQFIEDTMGARNVDVRYLPGSRAWVVHSAHFPYSSITEWGIDGPTDGSSRSPKQIIEMALNNTSTTIKVTTGTGDNKVTYVDQKLTEEAAAKVQALRDAFAGDPKKGIESWAWENESAASALEASYNEAMNRIVKEEHDGSHLTLPNLADVISFGNGETGKIHRPKYRMAAIWRIISKGNTLLDHAVGAGKAQPLDAKVLTPDGWRKMGDLAVGDMVIGRDGLPTRIVGVFPQGEKEIYRVTLSDGAATECCDEHLWLTQTYAERTAASGARRRGKNWPSAQPKVRALSEIRNSLVADHLGAKNHSIPMVEPVALNARAVPLDPYVVGVLIGDGCLRSRGVMFSSADGEIIDKVRQRVPADCEVRYRSKYDYAICFNGEELYEARENASGFRGVAFAKVSNHPVICALRSLGMWGKYAHEKRVPYLYLNNSIEVRLGVLRGLMDTDGYVSAKGTAVEFTTTSPGLAEDVTMLVQSLGGVTQRREKRIVGYRNAITLAISMPPSINPFSLKRKADRVVPKTKYAPTRYITSVELVGRKQAQCISVDSPEHLYVTDDFIVTHNTFTMIMSGMEQKRLGLIQRPAYMVPNHMLEQFSREFLQAYPNAKILVVDKESMSKDKRKEFAARVASEKWDGVIITHDVMGRITMSDQFTIDFIQKEIDELEDFIRRESGISEYVPDNYKGKDPTVKDLVKRRKRLRERLNKLINKERKDEGITFEEMGIDFLYVDEAHCFPHDTLVATDMGDLPIGEIVNRRLSVNVRSWDHETQSIVWRPVRQYWKHKRENKKFVRISIKDRDIVCTANHHVFVEGRGYVRADEVKAGETMRALRGDVLSDRAWGAGCGAETLLPPMREGVYSVSSREVMPRLRHDIFVQEQRREEQRGPSLLWESVCGSVAHGADREGGEVSAQDARGYAPEVGGGRGIPREDVARILRTDAFTQSDDLGRHTESGQQKFEWPHLPGSWREWDGLGTAEIAARSDRAPDGVRHRDGGRPRFVSESAELLQGRFGGPSTATGYRGGWPDASHEEVAVSGREEDCRSERARVVSVEVLEQGSDGEPRRDREEDQFVYDIGVEGQHNYFAGGLLVHNSFKNLSFRTRHTRIKGISTSASQRAQDLYMKIQYLEQSKPGRSVVFATGTPVSNTMAEMFIMQKYLQPKMLKEYGIDQFDSWASTFGDVESTVELAPNGRTMRTVRAFSRFVNIPELMTLYGEVADVQTAAMLKLPVPKVKGGAPSVVLSQMTDTESRIMDSHVARFEQIKGQRPEKGADNALKIMGEGLQLATDIRLLDPQAPFNPNGKVAKAVENIFRIWKEGKKPALGQIVFLDMGVPGSESRKKIDASDFADEDTSEVEGADEGSGDVEDSIFAGNFNLYQDMKDRLVAMGIPKEQIAFIHDAKDDIKKARMFADVKSGKIRILFGSTGKMGVGTNVQKYIVALHHIDAPWRPADLTQRDGRGLRQGNLNPEIELIRYITERTLDAYRWQTLERKSAFIAQLEAGARGVREAEDIDSPLPEAAAVKAAATGNPAIMEHAELQKTVREMEAGKRVHERAIISARKAYQEIEARKVFIEKNIADLEADAEKVEDMGGDKFVMTMTLAGGEQNVADRKMAGDAIKAYLLAFQGRMWIGQKIDFDIGTISGFPVSGYIRKFGPNDYEAQFSLYGKQKYDTNYFLVDADTDPVQIVNRITRALSGIPGRIPEYQEKLARATADLPRLAKQSEMKGYPRDQELRDANARLEELEFILNPEAQAKAAAERARIEAEQSGDGDALAALPIGLDQKARAEALGGDLNAAFDPAQSDSSDYMAALSTNIQQRFPEWADTVVEQARRLLPADVAVRVRDRIVSGEYRFDARYLPTLKLLELAMTNGAERAMALARHEAIHVAREMNLFTNKEWALLLERAKKIGIDNQIMTVDQKTGQKIPALPVYRKMYADQARMKGLTGQAASDYVSERIDQERVAKLAELWTGGAQYGSRIDKLFVRIKRLLQALVNATRGLGFQTDESARDRFLSGEVAKRKRIEPTLPNYTGTAEGAAALDGFGIAAIEGWHGALSGEGANVFGSPEQSIKLRDYLISAFKGIKYRGEATTAKIPSDVDLQAGFPQAGLDAPYGTMAASTAEYKADVARGGVPGAPPGPQINDLDPMSGYDLAVAKQQMRPELTSIDGGKSAVALAEEFFTKAFAKSDGGSVTVAKAYDLYRAWSKANDLPVLKIEKFRDAMAEAGYSRQRIAGHDRYIGIEPASIRGEPLSSEGLVADTLFVFDPRNIRSVNAAFDLSESDSADLLAALTAYHGSAASFSRFDWDKMREGGGHTDIVTPGLHYYAFGHHLGSDARVAAEYHRIVAKKLYDGKPFDSSNPAHVAANELERAGGDRETAVAALIDAAAYHEGRAGSRASRVFGGGSKADAQFAAIARSAADLITKTREASVKLSGGVYEVTVNLDDDEVMEFDRILADQGGRIEKAAVSFVKQQIPVLERHLDALADLSPQEASVYEDIIKIAKVAPDQLTGRDVVTIAGGPTEAASKAMKNAGIKAVKYRDEYSRDAVGSFNLVVFDDGVMDIVGKDGKPVRPDERANALAALTVQSQPAMPQPQEMRTFGESGSITVRTKDDGTRVRTYKDGASFASVSETKDGTWVTQIAMGPEVAGVLANIEDDIGQRLAPEGWLTPEAYVYWQSTKPEALRDHADAGPLFGGMWIPKSMIDNTLDVLGEVVTRGKREDSSRAARQIQHLRSLKTAVVSDEMAALSARSGLPAPINLGSNYQGTGESMERPAETLSSLVKKVNDSLGLITRMGRLNPGLKAAATRRGGWVAGQYSKKTGVTRLAIPNDLLTLTHEGGHALENRYDTKAVVARLKQQHAEDLMLPPAPNAPAPQMPPTGFSGIEIDAETQTVLVDAVQKRAQLRAMGASVGLSKQGRGPAYDARSYAQLTEDAGKAHDLLKRRLGQQIADAVMNDVDAAGATDLAAYAAQRFSASGQPSPRLKLTFTPIQLSEAWADWFAEYVTSPSKARDTALGLYDAFETEIDGISPEILEGLEQVQEGYQKLLAASPVEALRSRVQSTVRPGRLAYLRQQIAKNGIANTINNWAYAIIQGYWNNKHPMKVAVKYMMNTYVQNTGLQLTGDERLVLKAINDPYKRWRLAEHSKVQATNVLQNGTRLDGQDINQGVSMHDALKMAFGGTWAQQWNEEKAELFGSYLIARRMLFEFTRFDAGDLEREPDLLMQRDVWQRARDRIETTNPEFAKAADLLYEFNRNVLQWKFEQGFIDPKTYADLIQRQDYVPLNRIMDEDDGPIATTSPRGTNKRKMLFRFRGSTRDFINPLESIIQDVYATQARVNLNGVIRAMVELAEAAGPGGGAIAERLPAKEMKATKVNLREVMRSAAKNEGLAQDDTDALMDLIDDLFDQEASGNIFRATDINEKGERIVYLWEGGRRVPIRLGDDRVGKDIFEHMAAFGIDNADLFVSVATFATQTLRAGVTKAAAYIFTNLLRDNFAVPVLSESSGILSGKAFVPFLTPAKGLAQTVRNADMAIRYQAGAGMMGGVDTHLMDTAARKRDITSLRNKGFFAVPGNVVTRKWNGFLRTMEITEAATRVGHFDAAFKRAVADGMTAEEALWEAGYTAHDVMDFSRRGAKMASIARMVAFLNAAMQALSAFGRTISGERDTYTNYKKLASPYIKAVAGQPLSVAERRALPNSAQVWMKIVGLGLIGVALAAYHQDDEEYEEFNDYMKATHWIFKLNGVWYRYPKPFELAVVSNAMEAAFEGMWKDDPRALTQFINSLGHTFVPPHELQAMKFFYEMKSGKDLFRDRDIISQDIARLPPELQYNAYTSELGRLIGSVTKTSPAMVDHFMSSAGSTVARDIMSASDYVLPRMNEAVGGKIPGVSVTPRAEKSVEDYWFVSRFTRRAARGALSTEYFWKMMSPTSGEYAIAAEGFKNLHNAGRSDPRKSLEAKVFLNNLPEDQRSYAMLQTYFDETAKDLHPLNRAKQVTAAARGIRKEMIMGDIIVQDTKKKDSDPKPIKLTPSQKKVVNEVMEDLAMREARNALIVSGIEGWKQKKLMNTDGLLTELRRVSPAVADEYEARITKGRNKVYSFKAVQKLWPQVRKRILDEGPDAILNDLIAEAATY